MRSTFKVFFYVKKGSAKPNAQDVRQVLARLKYSASLYKAEIEFLILSDPKFGFS